MKNFKRLNVAVLFGGRSAEHEISIITALQAMEALDSRRWNPIPVYLSPSGKWLTGAALTNQATYHSNSIQKELEEVTILPQPNIGGLYNLKTGKIIPISICLLSFHGQYGEDGCIQGLLELADIPYTGCGVLASSLAMHKEYCKAFLKGYGIPVLPGHIVHRKECKTQFNEEIERAICTPQLNGFPFFVKPCHLGSSIAVSPARNKRELSEALAQVFLYDTEALIEPFLTDLLEVNISCCGQSVSVTEIPISKSGTLSYQDKYLGETNKFSSEGMASLSRIIDSSDLEPALKDTIRDYAQQAYQILGAKGVVRFDFMIDTKSNTIYFNELNPIPGSFSYYLWEKTPKNRKEYWLYPDILDNMLLEALETKIEESSSDSFLGFQALKATPEHNSLSLEN